jgi:hypothetical protein
MSNIFAGKKAASNDKVETDFVGGGGLFETDIYKAVIKTAYTGKAANSEARNVTLLLDVNGREVRQQIWVSNRKGELTYKGKDSKNNVVEKNLPGFNMVNSLCMLVCSKELGQMDVEELTVKLYDFDAKKELPQAVDCFVELHGETISIALQKQVIDKTALNASSGNYEPTGETRTINEVIKFFPEDKLVTISEVAEFIKNTVRKSEDFLKASTSDQNEMLSNCFDEVLNDGDLTKAISAMDDSGDDTYAAKWLKSNQGKTYTKAKGGGKGEGKSFTRKNNSSDTTKKTTQLFSD